MKTNKSPKSPKHREIILVNGKKRSGKNHFAENLQQYLTEKGKTSEILAFADPIKDILATSLCVSRQFFDEMVHYEDEIYVRSEVVNGICTARELAQNFGTEAMKKYFGDDVWVDLMHKKIQQSNKEFIIIPDFRFPNECISDIAVKVFDETLENHDTHISENSSLLVDWSWTVNNTGHPDISENVKLFCEEVLHLK